jgi:hypothetical protein
MRTKLLFVVLAVIMSLGTCLAYPQRFSSKSDYMELKVKPKPFQVAVDNPDDVQEMIVKDIANQKRVLIVAKNPQPFELGSAASGPIGGYFAPSHSMERYEYNTGNGPAIRAYYQQQPSRSSSSGFWKGSVLPASIN